MNPRTRSFLAIVTVLMLGNSLLAWYLVSLLDKEAVQQMANLRQYQEDEIVAEVRGRVETACTMIRHIAATTEDAEQAQKAALDAVSTIRFGENNYLWIHRLDPQDLRSAFMLVHPADDLRGRDNAGLIDLDRLTDVYYEGEIVPKTDPRVAYLKPIDLFTEFNRIAVNQGEGIVSYYWPKIVDGKATSTGYRKVAFIQYLPEWHWVVGAGVYADYIDLAMKERATQLQLHYRTLVWRAAGAMAGFSLIVVFVVSLLVWSTVRRQIVELKEQVEERRRAEAALAESEERYKTLFESAADAFMILDPESMTIESCNPAALAMFQVKDGAALSSLSPWDFSTVHQPDGEATVEKAKEIIAIALHEGSHTFEWMHRRLDGEAFPATVTLTRMVIGEKTVLHAAIRDVTEYKRMQEQLAQSQKMESIGHLAGGVAHDFNNLLAVILGYAEMLGEDLSEDSPFRDEIDQISGAGKRAKELTRQLLAFSRKQVLEMRAVDLNALVRGMETMLRRLLGEDIDMRVSLHAAPSTITGDPVQLEQVFMNLCVNARDAMPDGGILTIDVRPVCLDAQDIPAHPALTVGHYIAFTVSDTGCGMDEETREHIFDPFFTTKGKDKGTGLGLATVYGIVRQHGGDITVYSEPGVGSVFKVYLPALTSPEEAHGSAQHEETAAGNGETILLLEDEETVRRVAAHILKRLGYSVLEAGNAEECLRLVRSAGPIDLLLTDLILPGMNGRQVCDRVREIRPGVKTLFMSGYTEEIIAHRGILEEGVHFLRKPFTIAELGGKVREALVG